MRRKRRNHSPGFKAKVALSALKSEKTLAQLAGEYDVHVNQIQTWRNQLKDNMAELVDNNGLDRRKDHEAQIQALQYNRSFWVVLDQSLQIRFQWIIGKFFLP